MRYKELNRTPYSWEKDVKRKLTNAIKACGATLYQEADAIVGDYLLMEPGRLRIHISFKENAAAFTPTITVEHDYIPSRKEIDLPVSSISESSP